MLSRLTRILLALVTAFVFTGQIEAAAQHCARIVEQAAIATAAVSGDEAAPCHETPDASAASHGDHQSPADLHASHSKTPDRCECIAALKGCTELEGASSSTRIAPYVWLTPGRVDFASIQPEPDRRPPRA